MLCGKAAKRGMALAAAVSFFISATPAWSQTPEERSGARAAATEGADAFEQGRWSDSVDLFTRAESLVHSPVHLLYLARSYAKLGKFVRARENYIQLTNEQVASNAPEVVRQAKSDGDKELAELEPRIPYVSIVVQGAGPKAVSVVMDGEKVPPALLGVPRPVDPGDHKFQAFSEGMESSVQSITVAEARKETVVLTLVATPGAGANPETKTPESASQPASAEAAPAEQKQAAMPTYLPWIAFGVGAVGLGVGTIFALSAKGKVSDANDICNLPGGACPADRESEVKDLDSSARSANTISAIGFIAGGVGVAAGVTLLIVGNSSSSSVSAKAGPGWAGMSGKF